MSEEKTKTPSADDIVDDLAEEMGVDEEETTSDVEAAEAEEVEDADARASEEEVFEDEEEEEEEEEAEKKSDNMAGLGVFAVSKGKKKKKKKKDPAKEEKKKKKKKERSEKPEGVDLFKPEQEDKALDDILGDDYLDDLDETPSNPVNKLLVLVLILILPVFGFMAYTMTDSYKVHEIGPMEAATLLFTGEYQDELQRRVTRMEDEHYEALMAAMPRFGDLAITGSPEYGLVRLNGDVQYGQTSQGQWSEVRVGRSTMVRDISIDETHHIEVEAPGHQTETYTVGSDMWRRQGTDHFYQLRAHLSAADPNTFEEFLARMETGGPSGPFLGEVDFVSVPEGAQIRINSRIARDENGEEIRTPARLTTYWAFNEEDEELREEDDELRERDFRVDLPQGRGNRVELLFPDEEERPEYTVGLQRSMWECEWKDEAERRRISANAPIQEHCNYKINVHLDFDALQQYITEREEERERIEAQRREALAESGIDPDELEARGDE